MKSSLFALIALSFLNFNVWAGKDVGNGGGAWVCRESNRDLRWIKLIDFFEAENEFSLTVPESKEVYSKQVEAILAKVQSSRADFIFKIAFKKHLRNVTRNIHWLTSADIQRIDDALYRVRPQASSCMGGIIDYEQLANYTEYGAILVDKNLFAALTATQQAGLIVHEAVYAMYRERDKDQNSLKSRKIVGYLFSNQSIYQYDSILRFDNLTAGINFCGLCSIDFEAELAMSFQNGVALVKQNGRYGYIDSNGGVVLDAIYSEASEMKGGVAYTELPDFRGFIDKKGNRLFASPSSNFSNWYFGFENGVGVGGNYPALLVDLTGKTLFKAEDIYQPSEGMISYTVEKHRSSVDVLKYGYLDSNGSVVIAPRFDDAAVFKNGVARVVENGMVSFIDKTGSTVDFNGPDEMSKGRKFIHTLSTQYKMKAWSWYSYFMSQWPAAYYDPAFDSLSNQILTGRFEIDKKHGQFNVIGDFVDGRAPIYQGGIYNGDWAFIDTSGNFVTEPIFKKIGPFSQGLAPVQESNKKFGFIGLDGKYIIEPQFDEAYSFQEGYALVKVGNRYGYIYRGDIK